MDTRPNVTIELKDLVVQYNETLALRDERATFKGNVVAVIGHNGAGKSTFIKTILHLVLPIKGTVECTLNSQMGDLALAPDRHMAFCPEMGSVFTDIYVEDYVKLWCRLKQRDGKYYRREGSRYVEQLDLVPLLRKRGRELSKGQRRRVQTAIGFLTTPKLFLFDEPFDGLDVIRTQELTSLIKEHEDRMCFVVSSHRMDVMERLADFVVVLKDGRFVSQGTLEAVCEDLGGKTFFLRLESKLEEAAHVLQKEFPACVVTTVGSHICITGRTTSEEKILSFVNMLSPGKVDIESTIPSLVDAMNVHLKT